MKKGLRLSRVISVLALVTSLLGSQAVYAQNIPNDYAVQNYKDTTLYYNGAIITVNDAMPLAEAVIVGDGKIIAVGNQEELLKSVDQNTRLVNLEGKTMLPGFIDAHSHISMVGQYDTFSPAEGVTSNDALINEGKKAFEDWYKTSVNEGSYEEGDWFVGTGYDNTAFPNAVHPTAKVLDEISTEVPICIVHASNHMAVVNSKGLELLGYSKDSAITNYFGNYIGKDSEGNPNGVIKEDAFFMLYYQPNVMFDNTKTNTKDAVARLEDAMNTYASYGITTAQDGAGSSITQTVDELITAGKEMIIDIVNYNGNIDEMTDASQEADYINGIKQAGIKIILDGSPQGKTAWFNEPYYIAPEGYDADYRGKASMTDEAVYEKMVTCLENGYQLLGHTNGTAAIDQFITQYEKAKKDTGITTDLRPVLIHAQTITEEQLDRAEAVGIDISFFHDHVYYWGDYHLSSVLGPVRGSRISPLKTALERDINITMHQDSPIVPPDMIFAIHNAVNRMTKNGEPIGQEYAVDVMSAIKLVTINGAMQYFEEDTKGSIEVGKLADFVILDQNPLEVDKTALKDIKVLQTIKEDKAIYTSEDYSKPETPTEERAVVALKTNVCGSTISQSYTITALNEAIDISKLEIVYSADNMAEAAQSVWCDYAARQRNTMPWHTDLTGDVNGVVKDGVLKFKINREDILSPYQDVLKINLRISKNDWSMYEELTNESLEVYYDGQLIMSK